MPISYSLFTVVIGELGCDGTVAVTMVKTSEYALRPTAFLALNLNL